MVDVRGLIAAWSVLFFPFPCSGRARVVPNIWFELFEVADNDSMIDDKKK
jgi:hypothetical protein